MKNWNMLRALAVGVMVCLGQLFAFADTDMTQAMTATCMEVDEMASDDTMSEITAIEMDTADTTAAQASPLRLNDTGFDYKNTPEWRRFKIFSGVGIACTAVTCAGVATSIFFLAGNEGFNSTTNLFLGLSGFFLAGSVTSFILAYKNITRVLNMRNKAGQQVTADFGVGTLAAPLGGNRTELMPALSLSLSF